MYVLYIYNFSGNKKISVIIGQRLTYLLYKRLVHMLHPLGYFLKEEESFLFSLVTPSHHVYEGGKAVALKFPKIQMYT